MRIVSKKVNKDKPKMYYNQQEIYEHEITEMVTIPQSFSICVVLELHKMVMNATQRQKEGVEP